jgi:RNA polymerase sigma factor (sigma-70 family)
MATRSTSEVIHHLCQGLQPGDRSDLTDGQLLDRFVSLREAAAMEVLVRRHGPLVWGVCRRIVRNRSDAEDTFQATFLVLLRKAASIASRDRLASWLHGVARRTALKARARAAKRTAREQPLVDVAAPEGAEPDRYRDLQPHLDRELSRLPSRYRIVLFLCDLEGKTRKEAARQLGLPEGTVASRLARGRTKLAGRLARYAVAVTAASLADTLSRAASVRLPPSVVPAATRAATAFAADPGHAMREIPPGVRALTEGTLRAMLLSKLRAMVVVLLAVGAFASGAAFLFGERFTGRAVGPGVALAARAVDAPDGKKAAETPRTLLRWRLEKNKPFYQKITTTTDQAWTGGGQEAKETQTQTFYVRYLPTNADGDTWTVRQTIEGVVVEFAIDKQRIGPVAALFQDLGLRKPTLRYDSTTEAAAPADPFSAYFAALIGSEFTLTLNPRSGTVTRVEGRQRALDKMAKASRFGQQSERLLSQCLTEDALRQWAEGTFATLPGAAKAAGDSWQRPVAFAIHPPTVQVDSQATFTYEGKDPVDPKLEKIGVRYHWKEKPGPNNVFRLKEPDAKRDKPDGLLEYDARAGRVVRANLELGFSGSLTGEAKAEVPFSLTQKRSFEIADSSQLPRKK